MNAIEGFKTTLLIMAFYSVAITILAYTIPSAQQNYITTYELTDFKYDSLGEQMQGSLSSQQNLPLIELGALVFFSGNIMIDLILNFLYAIPQMIGLLISIIMVIFHFDNNLIILVQTFTSVIITSLYVIGLIQLLLGLRSGQAGLL